jgi:hypothetical protein
MADSVSVRCPECRREHTYTPPSYPCACGAPVLLPLRHGDAPVAVEHRTWADSWVPARCPDCGQLAEWPQPETVCDCGALLRMPVEPPAPAPDDTAGAGSPGTAARPPRPGEVLPAPRPAFRPVTIRTTQDTKTAAAQYLRWLGYTGIRIAGRRPASGVDLRGTDVIAHVDPTTTPTALRDIETLWLNGLNESSVAACFSLAGYSRDARSRADELSLPLFVLDLTGTPQPVNDAADDLMRRPA